MVFHKLVTILALLLWELNIHTPTQNLVTNAHSSVIHDHPGQKQPMNHQVRSGTCTVTQCLFLNRKKSLENTLNERQAIVWFLYRKSLRQQTYRERKVSGFPEGGGRGRRVTATSECLGLQGVGRMLYLNHGDHHTSL